MTLNDLPFLQGDSDSISIEMDTFDIQLRTSHTRGPKTLKSQELRNKNVATINDIINELYPDDNVRILGLSVGDIYMERSSTLDPTNIGLFHPDCVVYIKSSQWYSAARK